MPKPATRSASGIALTLSALAGSWVLAAHLLMNSIVGLPEDYFSFDLPIDIALALATSAFVYLLVRRELLLRERVQDELRTSQDELECRVVERTAALELETSRLLQTMNTIPDGVCIIGPHHEMEFANPALESQFGPVDGRKCHDYFCDLEAPCSWCTNDEVFAGRTVHREWISEKTGRTYEVVDAPLSTSGQGLSKLALLRDITERRRAEQEQTRLLSEIDGERRLLGTVLENAPAFIALLDSDELRIKWTNRQYPSNLPLGWRDANVVGSTLAEIFPASRHPALHEVFATVKSSGRSYYAPEFMLDDPEHGSSYWEWSVIPLQVGQPAKGELMLLAHDITEQVVGRKRMEEMSVEARGRAAELQAAHAELEARARELMALHEVSLTLASKLHSRPLLETMLDQLKTMIDYTGATVFGREDDALTILAYRGPVPPETVFGARIPLDLAPGFQEVVRQAAPVIVADIHADDPPLTSKTLAEASPRIVESLGQSHAWMGVPLMIEERVIGLLRFDHVKPGFFTLHHARVASAIASQAATALENARLYEEARRFAAMEERQRMALELHDSVSQALYGIALGAHAAREQVVRAPQKLDDTLSYVLNLAQTAVSEMRALVYELHPESLAQMELVDALTKMVDALRVRREIDLHLSLCEEPDLPIAWKEVLYRIAQEALHNVSQHSRATSARLTLRREDKWVILEISDDGVGFDPLIPHPGHYGLQSMRERAMKLGGSLEIENTPGKGSTVRAQIPT